MFKNKLIHITVNMYSKNVWVLVGVDDSKFDKEVLRLKKKYPYRKWPRDLTGVEMSVEAGSGVAGQTYRLPWGDAIVRLPEYLDDSAFQRSVVGHEFVHVAGHILRKIGMELTEESEEAYAYLVDFLLVEFYWAFFKDEAKNGKPEA